MLDRANDHARPLLRTVVGDVLRRTRREQRRTLADVADAAKVSMPYLSEVERGRKEASSEVLAAICAALGIGLADLLAEAGSDLLVERARRAAVISIDDVRRLGPLRDSAAQQPAGSIAAQPPAGSIAAQPPAGGSAATCLLAA